VLTLTNNVRAALHAQLTLHWLAEAVGDDLEIADRDWNFRHLTDPDLLAACNADAARAHYIIVAASDQKPLPAHVTQWLEHSLNDRRDYPPVLVALCDADADCSHGCLCATMRRIASEWHAPLVCSKDFDLALDSSFLFSMLSVLIGGSPHSTHR
jgi:hypothetical protein